MLLLEAVGSGDSAALRIKHEEIHARDHPQQGGRVYCPAELLHVTWGVVGNPFLIVFLEGQRYTSFVNQSIEELCRQHYAVTHIRIVKSEDVLIFVAHGEGAGRTGCEHRLSPTYSLTDA